MKLAELLYLEFQGRVPSAAAVEFVNPAMGNHFTHHVLLAEEVANVKIVAETEK